MVDNFFILKLKLGKRAVKFFLKSLHTSIRFISLFSISFKLMLFKTHDKSEHTLALLFAGKQFSYYLIRTVIVKCQVKIKTFPDFLFKIIKYKIHHILCDNFWSFHFRHNSINLKFRIFWIIYWKGNMLLIILTIWKLFFLNYT